MVFVVLYFEFLIAGLLSASTPEESLDSRYRALGIVFLVATLIVLPGL